MIAFGCPPSLRNPLVQAEVPSTNDSSIPPIQHGMFRCTSRCVTCQEHNYLGVGLLQESLHWCPPQDGGAGGGGGGGRGGAHITCTTSNIIYLIS